MERRKAVVGGRTASYLHEGSGEPILYLHGFPTAGYLWRHVMAVTGHDHSAFACDLPGFGHSDLMDGPHTWAALVDWVDAFLAAVGLEQIHLAVHDWGGLIGLAWAAKNPDRVASLLITDTSFRSKDRWHALAEQWRTPEVGEQMMRDVTRDGFAAMMRSAGSMPDDAIDEYYRGMDTQERREAKLEMYRSLDFEMLAPLEPLLPKVAPGRTRLVWGGSDPFVPPKIAHRMGSALGAEVVVLEETGHFLQEHRGPEIGQLHLQLLRSV